MSTASGTELHRQSVQLATQVLAAANRARASCVLLTSAERGAGKTVLADRMRLGLVSAGFQRHVVLAWNELAHVDPQSIPVDSLVFIDGPALHAGVDILSVPPAWRAQITGSVIVVMKRHTQRSELSEIVSWLQAAGWPPIGVVWNLRAFPRWRLVERLFGRHQPGLRPVTQAVTGPPPVASPPPVGPHDDLPSREQFTDVHMDGRIVQPTDPPLPPPRKKEETAK